MENFNNFFLVCLPGLEEACLWELETKWPGIFNEKLPSSKIIQGGIEISIPYEKGVILNYYLKIPTRILLRVGEFKARDFPKLYKKIKNFPWQLFLRGQTPKINVSVKNSRLIHTKRIEKAVKDGIRDFYKAQAPKKKDLEKFQSLQSPEIYIRLNEDVVTLSLNTSGEFLKKRGLRKHIGEAPLRENIAAGIFTYTIMNTTEIKGPIIDPMCGSGTLLFESHLYWKKHTAPFPFLDFNLKRPQLIQDLPDSLTNDFPSSFLGMDKDPKVLKAARENLKNYESPEKFTFNELDLFNLTNKNATPESIVITNPPYGKRIKIAPKFFTKAIDAILENIKPTSLSILIPREINVKLPSLYKINFQKKIFNGGIWLTMFIICRDFD